MMRGLMIFVLGLIIVVLALVFSPSLPLESEIFGVVTFSLITVYGLYYFLVRYLRRFRNALFFKNSFTVSGWRFSERQIDYSEIESLRLAKHFTDESSPVVVIRGQVEPFKLLHNPKNSMLHTDFYNWLQEKLSNQPKFNSGKIEDFKTQ